MHMDGCSTRGEVTSDDNATHICKSSKPRLTSLAAVEPARPTVADSVRPQCFLSVLTYPSSLQQALEHDEPEAIPDIHVALPPHALPTPPSYGTSYKQYTVQQSSKASCHQHGETTCLIFHWWAIQPGHCRTSLHHLSNYLQLLTTQDSTVTGGLVT